MLRSITRSGAPSPVAGMNSAANPAQHSANTIIRAAKESGIAAVLGGEAAGDGAAEDREEGRALDQRVAGRQLAFGEMIGQDAVFDRPEQRADDAEQEQGQEQAGAPNGARSRAPRCAAAPISTSFSRWATNALS